MLEFCYCKLLLNKGYRNDKTLACNKSSVTSHINYIFIKSGWISFYHKKVIFFNDKKLLFFFLRY